MNPHLYFTDQHEWILVEDDIGTVGISEYAQEQLGDVVYVELPEVGKKIDKGDEAAVVESVKAASEIYAPVTGEVIEVNDQLPDDPAIVNRSAMEDGWFFKIRISDKSELADLMNEKRYQDYVETL
jgi:glycine cleavage system H protein